MMMIHQREHPRVEVPPHPPWDWEAAFEEAVFSPQTNNYFSALKRYLPSSSSSEPDEECEIPFDCDNFRMYEFKIRKCGRGRSHDWTECPYAHPGEKARRRDPRKYHYSGTACPEFRRGSCRKGDSCEFAHGVFECWLHPGRYRTQPCKDGPHCKRRVCFFAHSPHQLRVLPPESPPATATNMRYTGFSPRSVFESFPDSDSPPRELANAMRGLQLGIGIGKVVGPRNMNNVWSTSRNASVCCSGSSLPTTPTGNGLDPWDLVEEVPMERVESGKVLRAKIYAKLSKDNSLDPSPGPTCVPDFQWVSDLLQS